MPAMKTLQETWHTFTAAPHRMMMLGGAAQGVLTLLWWLFDLLGRYGGLYAAPAWSIAPVWAHTFLMLYGFFPFFIFGFLMTTYPNWMNWEKIPPRFYIPAFLFLAGGIALFYLGLVAGKPLLLAGTTLILAGWGVALHALLRVLLKARYDDKRHPVITTIALLMGWLGILSYLVWLASDHAFALAFSRHAGIWWFMLPILLAVCHKMIPFFSSRVLENYTMVRPYWALYFMLACVVLHGALELMQQTQLLWLADFPLLAISLYLSYSWGLLRSFKIKLLAVLHVGFAWLSIAMLLYGLQSLTLLVTGTAPFGLAPLHALTIGFFASMILAMASRVTLGHSGRELVADAATWTLFLGFQLTAVVRITPDLTGLPASLFYPLAAGIWLACYGAWFAKYGPIFWRPRIDHRPG